MIEKMVQRYYTGGFFYMFLGGILIAVFTIFANVAFPKDANDTVVLSSATVTDEVATNGFTPPATTGFIIGIVGGGSAIMLTGWHLTRKRTDDWSAL